MPTATNEKRQENQAIRKATIGAAVPAPRPVTFFEIGGVIAGAIS